MILEYFCVNPTIIFTKNKEMREFIGPRRNFLRLIGQIVTFWVNSAWCLLKSLFSSTEISDKQTWFGDWQVNYETRRSTEYHVQINAIKLLKRSAKFGI